MRTPMRSGLCTAVAIFAIMGVVVSPALAETHPFVSSFGSFTNPNGIAVEESTRDVYVADIGTKNTVDKFDASGNPVNFTCGAICSTYVEGNKLIGIPEHSGKPAESFSFPTGVSGNPAAIAVDNSTSPSDPSRGDLYVMDAGHDAIDKFNSKGEYLSQIEGPFSGELAGLGVDAVGNVRVDAPNGTELVDVFNNFATNNYVTTLESPNASPLTSEHGFASGPTGDDYVLSSCGCMEKVGGNLEELGRVDGGFADVAAAVDPVTGHLYVDGQSSVAEWDTGGMNGNEASSGTLVSSFGSMSSSVQGGIAVNGASGDIYVANPAEGKVEIFSTVVPAVAAGKPASVTGMGATLQGTVDPRGVPVTSCEFEYETSISSNLTLPVTSFGHRAPCAQTPDQLGSGTSPVAVTADISGLAPGLLYHFRLVVENASGANQSSGLFATAGAA